MGRWEQDREVAVTAKRRRRTPTITLGIALVTFGCAEAHRIQVADVDSSQGRLDPFELHVGATGVSVSDAAAVAKAVAQDEKTRKQLDDLETIIALTQMGPKTGDPTFDDEWADGVARKVLERCPSGRITGLMTRRETMNYPVISGEIVTVRGYCIL